MSCGCGRRGQHSGCGCRCQRCNRSSPTPPWDDRYLRQPQTWNGLQGWPSGSVVTHQGQLYLAPVDIPTNGPTPPALPWTPMQVFTTGAPINVDPPAADTATRETAPHPDATFVLQSDSGDLWWWHHSQWTLVGNLRGQQGPPGIQGPVGPMGPQGVAGIGVSVLPPVPDEAARLALHPIEGNFVLQNDTAQMWIFTAGQWRVGATITGPQGAPGPVGPAWTAHPPVADQAAREALTPPTGPLIVDGTSVLQIDTGDLWQWTQAAGWVNAGHVVGAKGAVGKQGDKGDPGFPIVHNPVANQADRHALSAAGTLPAGTLVLQEDTGHLWGWTGTAWMDAGFIIGPPPKFHSAVADQASREALTPQAGNPLIEQGGFVMQTDTGHLWQWDGRTWIDAGRIVGEKGDIGKQGKPGQPGPQGPAGVGLSVHPPVADQAARLALTTAVPPIADDTLVLQLDTGEAWMWTGGQWTDAGHLVGVQGAPGDPLTFHTAVDDQAAREALTPAGGPNLIGANTAVLQIDTGDLWQWDGAAWTNAGHIRGPEGPAGLPPHTAADAGKVLGLDSVNAAPEWRPAMVVFFSRTIGDHPEKYTFPTQPHVGDIFVAGYDDKQWIARPAQWDPAKTVEWQPMFHAWREAYVTRPADAGDEVVTWAELDGAALYGWRVGEPVVIRQLTAQGTIPALTGTLAHMAGQHATAGDWLVGVDVNHDGTADAVQLVRHQPPGWQTVYDDSSSATDRSVTIDLTKWRRLRINIWSAAPVNMTGPDAHLLGSYMTDSNTTGNFLKESTGTAVRIIDNPGGGAGFNTIEYLEITTQVNSAGGAGYHAGSFRLGGPAWSALGVAVLKQGTVTFSIPGGPQWSGIVVEGWPA